MFLFWKRKKADTRKEAEISKIKEEIDQSVAQAAAKTEINTDKMKEFNKAIAQAEGITGLIFYATGGDRRSKK